MHFHVCVVDRWKVYDSAVALLQPEQREERENNAHRAQCIEDFKRKKTEIARREQKNNNTLTPTREQAIRNGLEYTKEAQGKLEKLKERKENARLSVIRELEFCNKVIVKMRKIKPSLECYFEEGIISCLIDHPLILWFCVGMIHFELSKLKTSELEEEQQLDMAIKAFKKGSQAGNADTDSGRGQIRTLMLICRVREHIQLAAEY